MGAPRVFVGMFGTLAIFATAIYFMTGSLTTTFFETVAAAILLQVGYFCMVVFLVWASARAHQREAGSGQDRREGPAQAEEDGALPAVALKRSPPFGPR